MMIFYVPLRLNPDPYWRNFTTERATNLSAIYPEIIKNYSFKNFDVHYMDHPDEGVIKSWIAQGMYSFIPPNQLERKQRIRFISTRWRRTSFTDSTCSLGRCNMELYRSKLARNIGSSEFFQWTNRAVIWGPRRI